MEACAYGSVYVRDFGLEEEEVVEKAVVSLRDVEEDLGRKYELVISRNGAWSKG